jgi:hypothetical protein
MSLGYIQGNDLPIIEETVKSHKILFTKENLRITIYREEQKKIWDKFISKSKNGTFLFCRDYMDYHSDRFTDHSLMFYKNNDLVAVMPANIQGITLSSHCGLTFGGIISDERMKTVLMLEIFESLKEFLSGVGIKKIIYKTIPYIYHRIPAEEDLYALFLNKAELLGRDVSSTILTAKKINFTRNRRRCIKKSREIGVEVKRSNDYTAFMAIEEANLESKYLVKPTHNPEEMHLLSKKFPDNIKLFGAFFEGKMVSGTIIYECSDVAHFQYAASTDEGNSLHGEDLVLDFLINDYYSEKKYIDFGRSTENYGEYLNKGLISYKEAFGARSTSYDIYKMDI